MKAFRTKGELDEDAPEVAELWALGCRGMQQVGDEVVAWFDEEIPLPLSGTWEDDDGTDWVAAYLAELRPVRIDRLIVAPTHADVTVSAGERVVWLDPGMAFGTGHHETTQLALRSLERLDLGAARVLDVGAGSGILAIAADLLGAASVLGVDVDAATLDIARHNARLNRTRARFVAGSTEVARDEGPWDVIVANLYAELHVRLLADYADVLRPGGQALLTGLLDDRVALLEAAIGEDAWRTVAHEVDGAWHLLHLERR